MADPRYPRLPQDESADRLKIMFRDCVMPEYYLKFSDAVDNFQVREDDVWVISQPRTGTTWTQEMTWCIGNDLDFEGAKEKQSKRFPFIEHCMLLSNSPNLEFLPRDIRDSVQYAAELPSPRFIKTHLPWQLLPKQIQDGTVKPKLVYVTRNAKDCSVSYYHHYKRVAGYERSYEDFCKLFMGDKIYYEPYWPHVLSFWERRDQPNILFLKYEDMKKDLPSVIKQTAAFLGKTFNNDQVTELANHLNFSSMQKNKAVNLEDVKDQTHDGKGQFIRKGVVGGWREMMSKELSQEFDEWIEKHLKGTGLTYEE